MIPFSPPLINEDVIHEVTESLESGWITTGPKVKRLESELSNIVGRPNIVCTNSWTSAAIMTLRWLGLKEDDEVIIPAYTYCATALAVIHAGGKPVMVDVNDDFNICLAEIELAITPKTKAIIPVDFGGLPCDYDELMDLINKDRVKSLYKPNSITQRNLGRILILADAAHSFGSIYKDQRMGYHPDVTIFSFHAVKNITTAEGGAIVFNLPAPFKNNELYDEFRLTTLNCQTKDAFNKSKAGSWRYDIIGLGMKTNMADINAAIAIGQLKGFSELMQKRESIFKKYIEAFSKFKWAKLPIMKDQNRKSSCHLFPLRIINICEAQRDEIINEITKNKVAVNVHFIPLPMLTYFKKLGYNIENFPVTYSNYSCEISLPIYPQLKDNQITTVIDSVIKAYNKVVG